MYTSVQTIVATKSSRELQHLRRTLEAELLADIKAAVQATQAHAGKLEMLTAVGAELNKRGHLLPFPAWQETDLEDGHRLSFSIRVF
jgi:hypothetical protein